MFSFKHWFGGSRTDKDPPARTATLTVSQVLVQIKRDDALNTGHPLNDDPSRFGAAGEKELIAALVPYVGMINHWIALATSTSTTPDARDSVLGCARREIAAMAVAIVLSRILNRRAESVMRHLVISLLKHTGYVAKDREAKAGLEADIEETLRNVVAGNCSAVQSIARVLEAITRCCRSANEGHS